MAGLLDAKGVGNITPQEIMESLGSFGLEGEEAEDILIQVGGVWGVFLSLLVVVMVVVAAGSSRGLVLELCLSPFEGGVEFCSFLYSDHQFLVKFECRCFESEVLHSQLLLTVAHSRSIGIGAGGRTSFSISFSITVVLALSLF